MMNEKENRVGMIKILENEMAKEMQSRKIGKFKRSQLHEKRQIMRIHYR